MGFVRVLGGYLPAVIVLATLATVLQSAFVLAMLGDVGAQISLTDSFRMIAEDLAGLAPLYGVFIALALAIAFVGAGLVHRVTRLPRRLVFATAGAAAMAVMLFAMEQVFFGIQPIAGARTLDGFAAQAAAGFIAGFGFAALTPPPKRGGA